MPHPRVVTGPIAGLEAALATAIAAARARDPLAPVTVLVGHVLLRPYLRRALAMRGVPQINVQYVRFHELAQQLAARRQTPATALTPAAERILVRDVAATATGYFASVRARDGFAQALKRLFRELDESGFTPETFAKATANAPRASRAKLDELAQLYAAYMRRRADLNVAGVAENYARALEAPFEGPLFVYGVWDPRHLQLALIERIAQQTDVTVYLPASGRDMDVAHAAFRERLRDLGAVFDGAPPVDATPVANVAMRLFAPHGSPNGSDPGAPLDITLVNAPDTVREVWEAARACLRWAEDGIPFHEMAVVYRNRDPYRDLVDEIFTEAGIETYLHDGRLLAAHPLGRRVLSLLALARDLTFARAAVMEFLTETELPRETRDRYDGRVRPSEWEGFTRDAGVVEGIDQWRERLERLAREKRDLAATDERFEWIGETAGRIDTLVRFAADFYDALAARREQATWAEHLAFLRGLTSRYAAGTEPIIEALDDLRQLEAVHRDPTFDVFARAVEDDLASRDTTRVLGEPVRLFGRQGVAVIDATSVRHMRFRAVYMLGVAERAWPPPLRPDPLLLEHERRAINAAGPGALPLRTEPDEEPLGFWAAAQAARDHLAVSFARADAGRSGKHLPSFFYRALAEAVERRPLQLDDLDGAACVRRYAAGRLAADALPKSLSPAEYDRGIIKAAASGALDQGVAAIAGISPAFGRAVAARHSRHGRTLTAYDGVMLEPAALAAALQSSAFAQGSLVSATRLEMYAECPYRYFLRHALKIEPIKEPETLDRMDHLQRGSLIHEILQTFLSTIGRDDPPRPEARDRHLALLLRISDEAGDERVRRGVAGLPIVWAHDKRVIDEDLIRWYDREAREIGAGDLRPGAFEARFGPDAPGYGPSDPHLSSDEPLALTVVNRTVRVQGRIDRVDWDDARTRFRVIDYKTGRKRNKRDEIFAGGKALQLAVYLRAAARLLGIPERDGEAMYFYVTSRGGFERHTLTGDVLIAEAGQLEQILTTIADGVDGGFFAPNPLKNRENCKWCDYADVCDARIDRIMERKAADPRGDAYRALEDIP